MSTKRIILIIAAVIVIVVLGLWVYSFLVDLEEQHQGEPPYPINLGSFYTIGSTAINPISLLDDIRSGKKLVLQAQTGTPDNPPFIMQVSWSQNDFLDVGQAYQKTIWQDEPNSWHLYKASFDTICSNASGKFGGAEFFFYQDAAKNGENLYSVREIEIDPEYGYLAWGADVFYPRPWLGGWTEIDLESIRKLPAEKALVLADQRGGDDFRKMENNNCNIGVTMWPSEYKRSDWSVLYSGKTSTEIWIPIK